MMELFRVTTEGLTSYLVPASNPTTALTAVMARLSQADTVGRTVTVEHIVCIDDSPLQLEDLFRFEKPTEPVKGEAA